MKYVYGIVILFLLSFSGNQVSAQYCGTGTSEGTLTMTTAWQTTATVGNGQIPYWTFSATAGYTYSFLDNTSGYDTYIRIYDGTPTQIAYNDDNGPWSNTTTASLDWVCPTTGTYTVYLSNYSCINLTVSHALKYKYGAISASNSSTWYFGVNKWVNQFYEGANQYANGSYNIWNGFMGYYTDPNVSFNSTNQWATGNNPGMATAPSGGTAYVGATYTSSDNFSMISTRQGFPCGNYSLSVPNHDDDLWVFVDYNGDGTWDYSGSWGCGCTAIGTFWTGDLGVNSRVVVIMTEIGGGASVSLTCTLNSSLAITSSSATMCSADAARGLTANSATVGTWSGTGVSGTSFSPAGLNGVYTVNYSYLGCSVSQNITVNPTPSAVTVSTAGTYCNNTTLTAANGSSGTMYYEGTTSGGTSTGTASSSQSVSSTGTYYFRAAAAGCWSTQGSAAVTINSGVSVTGNPSNVSLCAGSGTSTMSVTATGTGLTYQWRKNGTNLTNTAPFSGVTTATLTITNPAVTDAGTIDCVVSGTSPCSPVTSNTATLTVNALPQGSLTGNTICGDGNGGAQLTWTATAGNSPFSILYSTAATTNQVGYSGSFTSVGASQTLSPAYTPIENATYSITQITSAAGCISTTSLPSATVTVNDLAPSYTVSSATIGSLSVTTTPTYPPSGSTEPGWGMSSGQTFAYTATSWPGCTNWGFSLPSLNASANTANNLKLDVTDGTNTILSSGKACFVGTSTYYYMLAGLMSSSALNVRCRVVTGGPAIQYLPNSTLFAVKANGSFSPKIYFEVQVPTPAPQLGSFTSGTWVPAIDFFNAVNKPVSGTGSTIYTDFNETGTANGFFTITPGTAPTAGSNSPICAGSNLNLTSTNGSLNTCSSALTYSWLGPVTVSNNTSSAPTPGVAAATTAAGGPYTLDISGATNRVCYYRATTPTVVVNTRPVAAITGVTSTICNGGTATVSGTITASGAWTLVLSSGGTVTGTGSGSWSKTVSPSTTTTYTISTLTDANCSSISTDLTGSVTISVNTRPVAAITGVTSTICNGGTATVSGTITASGAWTLNLSSGGTVTGTGSGSWSKTVSPSTTTTYTISSLTDAHCSSISADLTGSVTITVNARPVAAITGTTATICNGGSATVNGTITASGAWTLTLSSGGTVTGTGSGTWSKTVSPSSTTTYTITSLTDANCSSISADLTGSVTITVNTRPVAAITGTTSTICNGGSATVNGTITASGAWTLTLSSGGTVTGTGSGTWSMSVSPSTTTTYTISSLSDANCSSNSGDLTGSVTISVNARPIAAITGTTSTICNGFTATVNGTITASGAWTLTLSSGGTVTGTGSGTWSKTVSPSSTTTYTISSLTDGLCSSISADLTGSVTINVNANPTIAPTSVNVCQGYTTSLTGSGTPNATTPWASSNTSWATVVGAGATATVSGILGTNSPIATYMDNHGCIATATVNVYSNPTATITPASPATCPSTGLGLTATPAGGTTPYVTNAWTGTGYTSLSSTTVTNPTFTNATAGSYPLIYTVTDNKGCTGTATTSVTVDPLFSSSGTANASVAFNQTICSSTTPDGYFNVSGATGGSGNFNYQWYYYTAGSGITTAPSGTTIPANWYPVTSGTNYNTTTTASTSANFTPAGTTTNVTYACYVTPVGAPACVGAGKWAAGQAQMTVSAPTAFETGGNAAVCTGTSVTLNATTPITIAVSWQWYAASAANLTAMESSTPPSSAYAISGATGTSLTVTSGNMYYIAVATYAGGSGCSPANSNAEYVTVNAQPSITSTTGASVCTSGTASLSAVVTGGTSLSYQWSYSSSNVVNGTPAGITYTSGTTNPLAIAVAGTTTPGTYTYTISVTDAGTGCTVTPVSTATLVVATQPVLSNITDVNICTTGTAVFTTTASGGVSNATGFTWEYKNGGTWAAVTNGVPANVSYSVSSVGETSTLTVSTTSGVGTGTAFQYRCTATFTGSGCATSVTTNTANLTPYPQPTITTQPGTTSICQGGTGTFNTVITGGVSPTYQWQYNAGIYHNVVDNSPATGITYSGSGTSDPLNISVGGSVTPGTYIYKLITSYTASGCPTTLPSSPATLQIASNPVVGTQPAATTSICDGTSTSLTIAASGGFGLTYQWQYYNSSTSTWNNVVNGTPAGVTYTGATSVTLGIGTNSSTTPPASYQYQCIVSSAGNNCNPATSATGTIVVNAVPAAFTPTVSTNPVCITTTGGGTNIQISSSVSGINYQLQTSGGSNIGSAVSGTGGTINLPTGTVATNSTYKVLATVVSGGCTYTSPATTTVVAVSPDVAFGGLIGTNHFNFGTIGSPTVPTGWTNPNNVSGVHWITNTVNPALSTSYSYYNSSGGTSAASTGAYIQTPTYATSNARVDLVTNAISTVGYSNVSVQWAVQVSPGYTGTDSLYYSLDGGSTWSNAVMFTDAQTNVTGSPWSLVNNTVQVKLPSACDNQANLALKWSANASTDGSYYSMNDIGIYGLGKITNCASSSINVKYLNTSCSLSKYSVYSDPSNPWPSATPFVPVTNATLPGSPISISVPAATVSGTYNLRLSVNDGAGDSSLAISFPVTQDPPISTTASLNNCSCNNSSAIFGNVVVVYASGGNGTYNFNSGAVVDSLVTTIDASGVGYAGTLNHNGVKAVFWSKADGAAHSYRISDGLCGNSATATVQSTVPTSIPFGSATLTPSGLPGAGGGNGISGSFTDSHFADATRTDINGAALKCLQTADFGNNWVTYQVNHIGISGDTTNNTAVVEINNRGQNLDSVSVSVYREPLLPEVNNSATLTTACYGYAEYGLERHFLIQSTKSTGTNVFNGTGIGVRLYFSDAEFQDLTYWTMYNATHATGLSASCAYGDTVTNMNSIYVTKYTGSSEDGSYTNNSPSGLYRVFGKNAVGVGNSALSAIDVPGATLSTGSSTNMHYVEMNVKEFSEFWLGGSQSIEPLPIQMIYLEAVAMNNDSIQLRWATASELNNEGFDIERSTDALNWTRIGYAAGHGNSITEQSYTYDDLNVVPEVVYYYRLKQIDNNGGHSYTDVVQAEIHGATTFVISNFIPNPTSGSTQLNISTGKAQEITLEIYDMIGQRILNSSQQLVVGVNKIDFDFRPYANGTYSVVIKTGGQLYAKKIVLSR